VNIQQHRTSNPQTSVRVCTIDIYEAAFWIFLLDSDDWVLRVARILDYLEVKPSRELLRRLNIELIQLCSILLVYTFKMGIHGHTLAIAIISFQIPNRYFHFFYVRFE